MTDHRRHPTAIIAGGAELADDVVVGPYAVIEDRVSIGAGSVIGWLAAMQALRLIRTAPTLAAMESSFTPSSRSCGPA